MTRPVGKIEVWEPGGGSALYTVTDFVDVYYKEIITYGVGNFRFRVYSHKDFSGTYYYPNIDLGDSVKIWLDWDTVAGDANFIGKVTKRSGPIRTPTGWIREICGLSQGEVLLRRHMKNKLWIDEDASAVAGAIATECNLGIGDIQSDTTDVTINVEAKRCFDVLTQVSDYWTPGGTVKKDFWVDLDGDLYWHGRPFRTDGVESFTTSDFLEPSPYFVIRHITPVKNDIVVYGAYKKQTPANEAWTEGVNCLDYWIAIKGTLSREVAGAQVGSDFVKCTCPAGDDDMDYRCFFDSLRIRDGTELVFYLNSNQDPSDEKRCRIRAPDFTNRFDATALNVGLFDWDKNTLPLGPSAMSGLPNGIWTRTGDANWNDVTSIGFKFNWPDIDKYMGVDGIYVLPTYFKGSKSDYAGTDRRELEVTDDKLESDSTCQKRAETLFYTKSNYPIQITVTVKGNDNVLVGDRLTGITIPSEGISDATFDVIAVENIFDLNNWVTRPTMVNSINIRRPIQTPTRRLAEMYLQMQELATQERTVGYF